MPSKSGLAKNSGPSETRNTTVSPGWSSVPRAGSVPSALPRATLFEKSSSITTSKPSAVSASTALSSVMPPTSGIATGSGPSLTITVTDVPRGSIGASGSTPIT